MECVTSKTSSSDVDALNSLDDRFTRAAGNPGFCSHVGAIPIQLPLASEAETQTRDSVLGLR
jgi:hypothetical protein